MEEKIKVVLAGAYMLPASTKAVLLEMGAEFDRLRSVVETVQLNQEKCKCK